MSLKHSAEGVKERSCPAHVRPVRARDPFPHKVCINLDRRPDRWERVRGRFAVARLGTVSRFAAFDGNGLTPPSWWTDEPGAYGCLMSHLAVVEESRRMKAPGVLIFEDDAMLDPEFAEKLPAYVNQLPSDWDMVLLGGIHGAQPAAVSDNVVRVTHSLSTFAYALRETIYDAFIALNREARTTVDDNNRALQKRFNCYCFMPHLAWVEDDYSDVRNRWTSHWWLKDSLVLWGDEMRRVLAETAVVIAPRLEGPDSVRNLQFLAGYYSERLPGASLLVVEQDERPRLAPGALPDGCRYEFLKGDVNSGPDRAFGLGFETFERRKGFFVFADGDLFIERDDVKASLLKCRGRDFVRPFREVCPLGERGSRALVQTGTPWAGASDAGPPAWAGAVHSSFSIFSRDGFLKAGGAGPASVGALYASRASLSVFESPCRAWRLFRSGARG